MPRLTIHDLRNLRTVLRHISSSDYAVQNEALRLDALLAEIVAALETSSHKHHKETR